MDQPNLETRVIRAAIPENSWCIPGRSDPLNHNKFVAEYLELVPDRPLEQGKESARYTAIPPDKQEPIILLLSYLLPRGTRKKGWVMTYLGGKRYLLDDQRINFAIDEYWKDLCLQAAKKAGVSLNKMKQRTSIRRAYEIEQVLGTTLIGQEAVEYHVQLKEARREVAMCIAYEFKGF